MDGVKTIKEVIEVTEAELPKVNSKDTQIEIYKAMIDSIKSVIDYSEQWQTIKN